MLSENPRTAASRRWYQRHKDEPGFMERQRQYLRDRREKLKHTKEFKEQKAKDDLKYRLKIRDSAEFREKRNVFNRKYWSDPNRVQSLRDSIKTWRQRNPEKTKAHNIVNASLRARTIFRPNSCTSCGCTPPAAKDGRSLLHAHHADYSKPLEVQWLCASCHGKERRKYR